MFVNRQHCVITCQVLMATELKRTDSMLSPQLFHFDDHFEFEEIIGRSTMSEVGTLCWGHACLELQTNCQGPPQNNFSGHDSHKPFLAGVPCAAQDQWGALCREAVTPEVRIPCAQAEVLPLIRILLLARLQQLSGASVLQAL